jgi:hypothetical protein
MPKSQDHLRQHDKNVEGHSLGGQRALFTGVFNETERIGALRSPHCAVSPAGAYRVQGLPVEVSDRGICALLWLRHKAQASTCRNVLIAEGAVKLRPASDGDYAPQCEKSSDAYVHSKVTGNWHREISR